MNTLRTPLHIELLIHYACSREPYPRIHAPAVREYTEELCKAGLIEPDLFGCPNAYHTTGRGDQMLSKLEEVPLPPKPAKLANGHNPRKLSEEAVGVADGWRLLESAEIVEQPIPVKGVEVWGSCGWVAASLHLDSKDVCYRTRLAYPLPWLKAPLARVAAHDKAWREYDCGASKPSPIDLSPYQHFVAGRESLANEIAAKIRKHEHGCTVAVEWWNDVRELVGLDRLRDCR